MASVLHLSLIPLSLSLPPSLTTSLFTFLSGAKKKKVMFIGLGN
uniref:Uncharacterized protein n=1 Tax=Anguilla anguilla TaxID=7936 RepID=A0A0E9WGY2_ANGAN